MNIKRLTCAFAVFTGVATALGAAPSTLGAGAAAAEPGRPSCDFGGCQSPGGHDGRDPGPRDPGGPTRPIGDPGRPEGPVGPHGEPGRPGGPRDRGEAPPPPPRDLAWRGIDQGRRDHQPFNYNGHWVTPLYNPVFDNWGFWLFGIWIPL